MLVLFPPWPVVRDSFEAGVLNVSTPASKSVLLEESKSVLEAAGVREPLGGERHCTTSSISA